MSRATPMSPVDRRAQLLSAARVVFAERGFHNAGVAHIIREAGVARGTFYNYFESKRVIFNDVLAGVMVDLVAGVKPIDVQADIPTQAREIVRAIVSAALQPHVARLLFAEAVGVDAEGDAALRDFYATGLSRIEVALGVGNALGIVRDGDMRLAARCLLGMVKENVFMAALLEEPLDPDALVDELYAFMTGGLLRVGAR
jgi:AcrR family transcriptional regulator